MAAPNYGTFTESRARSAPGHSPSARRPVKKRLSGRSKLAERRRAAKRRQRFLVLVVVPVLLLLGSVYLHGVSGRAADRVNLLNAQLRQAQAGRQSLEVGVAKLSAYDRIRSLAEGRLGMEDPKANNVKVYNGEGNQSARGSQKGAR